MTEDELRARIQQIRAEMQQLNDEIGENAPTEAQQTRWDALDQEHDQRETALTPLVQAREAETRQRTERAQRLADSQARWGSVQITPSAPDPFDGADLRGLMSLARTEVRDRALRVADDREHVRHLADDQRDQIDRLLRGRTANFDNAHLSRLMLLTQSEHYRTGWQKIVTQPTPMLTPEESRALHAAAEYRAMSGSVDTAGGFAVPVLIDPTVILTSQGSLNPFRRISRVEQITTDEWRGVSSAGVSWSYDVEATAVSDDSPAVAQPTVAIHEARGWVEFTIRLGQDWPGFANEMSTLLNEGYDELQAASFATGTGSNQPWGIITALDANTNVEVVVTTDGAFGGVDINKIWGVLPDRFKQNSSWVLNHDVGNEIATFGNGNNLSFVTVDLTGVVETIRSRPIEFSSYFPDFTGTTGASNILVVGDFRNYLIADRIGMTVELVPHVPDPSTGRPTGKRGWYAYARHGADSINDNAFRLLQNQ
ncbi:phage major capsid protein [Candidatus Frankia alpina]|uniref:Phage major capsid protein n=1 Tax=Candidatus Frankia alpina TaxID=2699483 RepID=A0A4S5ETN4_9ACTN|nr:phage major capsid protein [Candidatus Frankia alpina]THJ75814.1 phage major capsid protein [Candidatus Frankia alpina]